MKKEKNHWKIGIWLALAIATVPLMSGFSWLVRDSVRQISEVQKFRRDWNERCLRRGGTIVSNGKGSPSYLCFGPDGRLLETR